MQPLWQVREADPQAAARLAAALELPAWLAGLLVVRGVADPEHARSFLSPALGDLADPRQMRGLDVAIARLVRAAKGRQRVTVWGDYDVDGITSVALLTGFLRELGLEVDYYIPSRLEEGYGLNGEVVRRLAEQGTRLLVTVDCGISDQEPIALARQLGLDVVVIDHHQVPEQLPAAVAVLDPHQPGCRLANREPAAVGVVFYLLMGLRRHLRELGHFRQGGEPNLRRYLDLVALGTIADAVPLVGDNRVLAHFGLEELTAGRRPGVAALKEVAGLMQGKVSAGQVAFRLAPRLNAVGRLGRADQALELLSTDSYARALELARELEVANQQRQAVEQQILEQALREAERLHRQGDAALVLWSEQWHAGVVGIVAARLAERFSCPAVLIALEGDQGQGSARSTETVHLYRALQECDALLEAYGGHRAAAGLRVRRENLEKFRRSFATAVAGQVGRKKTRPRLLVDAELDLDTWTAQAVKQLQRLRPFGLGNPEPTFLARGLQVKAARLVGREGPHHLKLALSDGWRTYDAIGFSLAEELPRARGRVDIIYTPSLNEWEGGLTVQLRLRALRPAQADPE